MAVAIAGAGCSSSSTSTSSVTTGPTPAKCQITLTAPSNIIADGGTGTISVAAQPECEWTVSTQTSWITDISPASGQGNGNVAFRAMPNAAAMREGEIVINDSRARIMQEAAPCRFTLTPTEQTLGSAAGESSVAVVASNGCAWTATSNAPFITITSGASGSGNGTVSFNVLANSGNSRTGTLTIADRTHTVTQLPPGAPAPPPTQPCIYTTNPAGASIAGEGGSATATVTTAANCPWTAVSNVPWITVTSGASGSGNGSVAFTVAANGASLRTGTLTIAGQTLTITQAVVTPTCSYTINPTSANAAPGGGAGPSVTVTTTAGCAWTAASNDQWITVTSGASGNGSGTVGYTVAANAGSARNGTLTIAGRVFTVIQAAPAPSCTYAINPTSSDAAAGGGAGPPVTVTTTAGCAWTAASNEQWITVTSGASGNGSGTVGYSVAANAGGARNGTLAIAGHTFSVTQPAPPPPAPPAPSCSYTINPASASAPPGGGAGPSVSVTTTAGCAWTAASNEQWITVTSGASGNGNGTVGYNVAANNTGSARNGTLTIAGRPFTVNQAAPAPSCNYSINPTSANVGASGGAGPTVAVTTAAGCTWTASSNAQWISEMAGNRTGSGTLGFSVAANNGNARTGTLTIAGQTFTVTQASGCTYTLDSTSATFSALGGADSVRVSAPNSCAWTATTSAPWINITGGASDTGNGMVRYSVSLNAGPARNGTITIAGHTFTVTQNGVGGRLGASHNDVTTDAAGPR